MLPNGYSTGLTKEGFFSVDEENETNVSITEEGIVIEIPDFIVTANTSVILIGNSSHNTFINSTAVVAENFGGVISTPLINLTGGVIGPTPPPLLNFGLYYDNTVPASISHISLYSNLVGFGLSSDGLNYFSAPTHTFFGLDQTNPVAIINSTATYIQTLSTSSILANASLGTTGNFLASNGTTVHWTTPPGTNPPGANTEVFFNDSGAFGANAEFRFNKTSKTLHFGNSTVNAFANSIQITVRDATNTANLSANRLDLGLNSITPTGYGSGANVSLNSIRLSVGNTTANLIANSIIVSVANSTETANLQPTQLVIGTSIVNTSTVSTNNVLLNGGVSGATPTPPLKFNAFSDNSGNPTVSHIDLSGDGNTGFGISANGQINYLSNTEHAWFVNNTPSTSVMRLTNTGNLRTIGHMHCLVTKAIPVGGETGNGLMFSSTSNFGIFFGANAPSLAAAQGSLYLRTNGSSTTTRMYVNTDGGTTWTAVNTVA
jgi:hypothetical protein